MEAFRCLAKGFKEYARFIDPTQTIKLLIHHQLSAVVLGKVFHLLDEVRVSFVVPLL